MGRGRRSRRLMARMRGRDVRARPQAADLRHGRPDPPPDLEPLRCERCGGEVSADEVECLYGGYWLCPRCAGLHKALGKAAAR
jgi:hypothetical protein